MRSIDRRVGVPLCAALTGVRRLRRDRVPAGPPSRIVIIKLAEQGATVAAHQALVRAAEMVGRDQVFVLVFAENRSILDELGVVQPGNVVTMRTTSRTTLMLDALRAVRRLRRAGVDAVVDFESFSRASAILSYLTGCPIRVGLHSYFGEGHYRGDLLTHRVAANPHLHARRMFDALVAAAGKPAEQLPAIPADQADLSVPELPRVQPTLAERATVTAWLASGTVEGRAMGQGPVVLLNANVSDLLPLRRWPPERYTELAQRLLDQRPDLRIVLTGAPGEAVTTRRLATEISSTRCIDLGGRTTLRELLVLMEVADVLVTNDSGPAHFAGLTGIEAITLFGPETPVVFGPESDRAINLWQALPCSPCVNAFNDRQSACTDNICMTSISVDQVLTAVDAALTRSGTRPSRSSDTT